MKAKAKTLKSGKRKPAASFLPAGNPSYRKWREQFNPLKGLTIRKAVTLLEAAQRGEFAEYQWTCRLIERRFPELSALIARRTSALAEMDWEIKVVAPETPDKVHEALAKKQADRLREVYEGIANIYEAIEVMAMAAFRGFGFCEKIVSPDGDLVELRPVACWNLVRDGALPRWKYNPDATMRSFESMPGDALPLERFVWRDVERPLNEIALVLFLRANNANKNWDAFLEIYAVPGGVVIAPPNVPEKQMAEFKSGAAELAQGGSGALPHGSIYTPNDGPRGTNPFTDHLKHVSEQLVLAGTGGKLTMLNDATGIGGSQGDVHADVFRQIASADAREVSEIFQRQIDASILDEEFHGEPRLAYFELNFREEVDAKEVVEMVGRLSSAGFACDPGEIGEKVGLKLTEKAEENAERSTLNTQRRNKEKKEALENREASALDRERLKQLRAMLPDVFSEMPASSALAEFLEEIMAAAFVAGAADGGEEALENANPYHDGRGRFTFGPDAGGGGRGGAPAPVKLTGEEFGANLSITELRRKASAHLNGLRGSFVTNYATQTPILIDRTGEKEATSKFRRPEELQAIAGIKGMIEGASYAGSTPDTKGRAEIKAWHEYEVPVEIAGVSHDFTIKVRELSDGHRFYDSFSKKSGLAAKSGTTSGTLGGPKANTSPNP